MAMVLAQSVSPRNIQPVFLEDVPSSHPAYAAIQQVIDREWMTADKQRFQSKRSFTRAEGAAILVQSVGAARISPTQQAQSLAVYPESKAVPQWAKHNLAIALNQKILNTEKGLRPRDLMTWGELCYGLKQLSQVQTFQPGSEVGPPPTGRNKPVLGVIGAIALGTVGFALWQRDGQRPAKARSHSVQSALQPQVSVLETVKCLLVTELHVSATGQVKTLRQNVKVLLFPASFGSDLTCTYVVSNLPMAEGRLFTIAHTATGELKLLPQPQKSLLCNGMPVPPQGMVLDKHSQFKVEYQHWQWILKPLCEIPQSKNHSAYFAQLGQKDH